MSDISIDIEEEKENKLLNRRELVLTVHHDLGPTPDRGQIKAGVASLTGFDKGQIVVDSVNSEFGLGKAKVLAKLYNNKEDAIKYERKHQITRNKLKG
ncbi:MAG: 30S ribosomal protein S24e [Thermoplasmata archaeon]